MPFDITFTERLEIQGVTAAFVPLGTSCLEIESLAELWGGNRLRGDNRPIPGVDGVDERTAVIDEARKAIAGWIYGTADWDGAPPAVSVRRTLQENVKYLRDELEKPTGATKTARLYLPDGTYREKPVQVKEIILTPDGPTAGRLVFDLNFTKGLFEL